MNHSNFHSSKDHVVELFMEAFKLNYEKKNINIGNMEMNQSTHMFPEEESLRMIMENYYTDWICKHKFSVSTELIENIAEINLLIDIDSRVVFDWFIKFKILSMLIDDIAIIDKILPCSFVNKYYLMKKEIQLIKQKDNLIYIKGYIMDTLSYFVRETWISEAYRLPNKCDIEEGDIVLDVGACAGETSIWFADRTGKNGKVYSFEMDRSVIPLLYNNIERNHLTDIIKVVEKGLWNKTMTMSFSDLPTEASIEDSNNTFSVTTLDDFVESHNIQKINFIKMDIEGSELNALEGASKTISTQKPKLVICIYHKYYDIINILNYIHKLVPEYHLCLSQKDYHPLSTVVFCYL